MPNFSINTNVGALTALQQLNLTNVSLLETQNRVNSGLKVRGAKDDAGTFAIAQNLRADLRGYEAVKGSLDRAISALDIGLTAAESISDLLIEAKEKAVAASDEGIDDTSRNALNTDFQAILGQISTIATGAEFNGTNLIGPSPDNITAITDPSADSTRVITVAGADLTATGALATLGSVTVGGDVTLDSSTFQNVADVDGFQEAVSGVFNDALRTAIDAEGLDVDDVLTTASPPVFDFTNSEATFTNDGGGPGLDTVVFRVGDATITVSGADFGASLANFDTYLGTGGNALTVTVSGSETVTNGTGGGTTLTNVALGDIDLTNAVDRAASIPVIQNYLDNLNDVLISFGSGAKTLETQRIFVDKIADTVETGIGNLVDANLARESAALQALQVKQQLGIQALSIANGQPQVILSLFGN